LNPTKYVAVLLFLGCLALAFAQQPGAQSSPSPSGSTPPTFPPSAPKPTQKADEQKPARPLTSQELKIQIVQNLLTTPELDSQNINVKVTNDKVELKGSVPSADQRSLAEQVVQLSAGNRRIENRLRPGPPELIELPRGEPTRPEGRSEIHRAFMGDPAE
jgi:hypothetical protein